MNGKMPDKPLRFLKKTVMIMVKICICYKVGLVSLAQSMRDRKRCKVDEFGRGFSDFPTYFSVKFCLEKAEFQKKLKS